MKKKGSALIYVLIILIPAAILVFAVSDLAETSMSISNHLIKANQAYYNAEAGITYGVKKLQLNGYNQAFPGYNTNKFIIFDNAASVSESRNYSETTITFFNGMFTINSKGYYMGLVRTLSLEITKP